MAGPALKEKIEEVETRTSELGIGLVNELAEIIASVEYGTLGDTPELAHWFYRVPCPGVRYYAYQE